MEVMKNFKLHEKTKKKNFFTKRSRWKIINLISGGKNHISAQIIRNPHLEQKTEQYEECDFSIIFFFAKCKEN